MSCPFGSRHHFGMGAESQIVIAGQVDGLVVDLTWAQPPGQPISLTIGGLLGEPVSPDLWHHPALTATAIAVVIESISAG